VVAERLVARSSLKFGKPGWSFGSQCRPCYAKASPVQPSGSVRGMAGVSSSRYEPVGPGRASEKISPRSKVAYGCARERFARYL
jgi:hypothetical protein